MRLIRSCGWMLLSVNLGAMTIDAQTLDRNAQRAVNDATKELKSRDVQKRVDAVEQLAAWGKLTTAHLVIGALKDVDARVRAAAADALWDDDMKSEAARGPLTSALDDPSADVAVLAAGALRVLGLKKADVQKANERGLSSSSDLRIRFLAARGLIGLVPPARLVGPLVTYLARQAVTDTRSNIELAQDALEELRDTKDRTILAPLMEAIPGMAKGAHVLLKVLGEVQPRPGGWTASLVAHAGHSDANLRQTALILMRDLKSDADVAQWSPVAARLLAADADDVVRNYAASALSFAGGAGHAHADAVLLVARRDRSAGVRASAIEALAAIIGRTSTAPMTVKMAMARKALPELQSAIESDPDKDVKEKAVDALDALALDPSQSASLLAALAAKSSLPERLRVLALSKLRNRGGDARSVSAEIEKLTRDSNAAVRESATEAFDRVTNARAAPAPARAAAAAGGRGATPAAAGPKPSAEDEARGLSIIRARKVEFEWEQFYRAIGDTDVELARAFLDAGMSAKNRFASGRQETPLMVAVSGTACSPGVRPTAAPTVTLVQLLIARGADASVGDENGNTPLMQAAMGGCDAVIMSALLKAGGQVNAKSQSGLTAFEFGLFSGHDGLDALLAAGYRLPADKAKVYLEAYKDNPKAVALIKRASQ